LEEEREMIRIRNGDTQNKSWDEGQNRGKKQSEETLKWKHSCVGCNEVVERIANETKCSEWKIGRRRELKTHQVKSRIERSERSNTKECQCVAS
jgi:hypothetical protein